MADFLELANILDKLTRDDFDEATDAELLSLECALENAISAVQNHQEAREQRRANG